LNTVYNIMASGDHEERHFAEMLQKNYIDKGFLGMASGRGFASIELRRRIGGRFGLVMISTAVAFAKIGRVRGSPWSRRLLVLQRA
jgi:3-hydroxyacyl-CoA dehydrogenase